MKKYGVLALLAAIVCVVLMGCGQQTESVTDQEMTLTLNFGERAGIYSGEVANGLPNGEGSFTAENEAGEGWTYTGIWGDGHMMGQGEIAFDSGYQEKGSYENDFLNGDGELYNGDMLWQTGVFVDGQMVNGVIYAENGEEIYSGELKDGFWLESEEDSQTRLAEFKATAVAFDYESFLADPAAWQDRHVYLTGTVSYVWDDVDSPDFEEFIIAQNGDTAYQLDVCRNLIQGESKQTVDEQNVTVYGIVLDFEEFFVTMDDDSKLPCLRAVAVE